MSAIHQTAAVTRAGSATVRCGRALAALVLAVLGGAVCLPAPAAAKTGARRAGVPLPGHSWAFPRGRGTADLSAAFAMHGAIVTTVVHDATVGCCGDTVPGAAVVVGLVGAAGGALLGYHSDRRIAQMVNLGGTWGLVTGAWLGTSAAFLRGDVYSTPRDRFGWHVAGDLLGLVAGAVVGRLRLPEPGRISLATSGLMWGGLSAALVHRGTKDAEAIGLTSVWMGATLGGITGWLAWDALPLGRSEILAIDAAAVAGLLAAPVAKVWVGQGVRQLERNRVMALAAGVGVLVGVATATAVLGRAVADGASASANGAGERLLSLAPGPGRGLALVGRW